MPEDQIKGARRAPGRRLGMRTAGLGAVRLDSLDLVLGEAALAADLITAAKSMYIFACLAESEILTIFWPLANENCKKICGEAALAADLITARKPFRGGCASSKLDSGSPKNAQKITEINPHQRCGYSDSPFSRKDTFLYCRGWAPVGTRHKKLNFQVVIKSAASAASPKTKIQESRGA